MFCSAGKRDSRRGCSVNWRTIDKYAIESGEFRIVKYLVKGVLKYLLLKSQREMGYFKTASEAQEAACSSSK